MTRYSPLILALLVYSSAQAQVSLSDQINAVSAAQENERARQQMLQSAASERAAQAAAQQRTAAIAIEHQRIAAQAAVEQQRIAAQVAIEQERAAAQRTAHDEGMADKKRDQDYEDQLRTLQVQQAKLNLLKEQQSITTDKERDQAYQDKLRELDLQQKVQELKRIETRVSRENDFIDRDLRHQDAQTDVVQSGADATRNVSEGAKTYMQEVGAGTMKAPERSTTNRVIDR